MVREAKFPLLVVPAIHTCPRVFSSAVDSSCLGPTGWSARRAGRLAVAKSFYSVTGRVRSSMVAVRRTAGRLASLATRRVVAFPNNVLGNGRTLAHWQVRAIQLLFLGFAAAELALGSYVRDWGLFSARFVGGAIAVAGLYVVLVWLLAAVAHLRHRNEWVDGSAIYLLSDSRKITLRRLWLARILTVAIGGLVGYPLFLYALSRPSE